MRLEGKAALITGVDASLGRQIAVHFAREGASVAGVGQTEDGARAIEELQRAGGTGVYLEADTSKRNDAEKAVAGAIDAFGRIDVLVNYNPVRRILGTIVDMTDEEFDEQMTADVMRVVRLGRHAIPAMAKGGGGAVINISSINSDGLKGRALRSASKAALNSLTIAMALDHGPQHIRVNALVLGPVGASGGRGGDGGGDPSPIGQVATLDQVAAAAVFLASEEAAAITGVLLRIDGGRSLRTSDPA
ncbi:MAG: SDR family oxidoreductase [Chloroflexi bacterium]|nr:SDR family oxidoreductase [Chloroflexota bacterium]MCI0888250.1 SDR family oxidoreductase [Chloroflexota bacterium]